MIEALLKKIAADLNIRQELSEPDVSWKRRVVYSLIGLQMLTSLYDHDDSEISARKSVDSTVSMQHVLKRGKMLVEIFNLADFDTEKIREQYVNTGYMLHKNNRLAYPKFTASKAGSAYLLRGLEPWLITNISVSGLGLFTNRVTPSALSVEDMFNISKQSVLNWYNEFIKNLQWEKLQNMPQDVEWLNVINKPHAGYWSGSLPTTGVSLCRSEHNGEKAYTLVKVANTIDANVLPQWRVECGEYLRVAIALRNMVGNYPTLTAKKGKYTVEIKYNYLLPPNEQNLIELYSWSKEDMPSSIGGRLSRIMAFELWNVFKVIFERFSYQIQES